MVLEHRHLPLHQLQPLLLQLPQRPRRPCSRCPHYLGLRFVHFSHHCQRLHSSRSHLQLCRQSASPSFHRHYLQGEVERVPCFSSQHSRQLQHLLLQMLSHPLLSRLLLPRTLFQAVPALEPRRQLHLQSVQLQQAVLTTSSRPSPRIHRPTTTTTMTRTVFLPYHDSRISSSPLFVL
jgi:hypothetical protein